MKQMRYHIYIYLSVASFKCTA